MLVAGVVLIMNRAEEFFSIDNLNPESAEDVFTEVTNRTDKGGSEFDAPLPTNPVGFVAAVVTVLFRPFPFEATNGLAAATSLEATVLLVIVVRSYKSLKRVPGAMVRSPWVSAALVYVLGFSVRVQRHRELRDPGPPARPGAPVPVRPGVAGAAAVPHRS